MKLSPATIDSFPKRSLSGSSMQQLAQDLQEVVTKLEEAKTEMVNAQPHPRDYIHEGAGTLEFALNEHKGQLKALDDLISFYEQKRNHCLDQMG